MLVMKRNSGNSSKLSESRNGFTIVELLIVVVVIAILATITIVSFRGVQERAYVAATVSNIDVYIKGLEMLKAETGAYSKVSGCIGETSGVCGYTIIEGDKCQSEYGLTPGRTPVQPAASSTLNQDLKPYISTTPKQSMTKPVQTIVGQVDGCVVKSELSSPGYFPSNGSTIQSDGEVREDITGVNMASSYYIRYTLNGDTQCTIGGSHKKYYPENGYTTCYVFGGKVIKE